MSVRVLPVRCLRDNYAYVLSVDDRHCVVVDPSEAAPVQQCINEHNLTLVGILNTHHHYDHVGGNETLCSAASAASTLRVVAHESDRGRVPEQTDFIGDDGTVELAGMSFGVMHVPGHTLGAIAYLIDDMVFTGDTLFVAGCGRMFEGTPPQMHASLMRLASLPPETRVYCGHEYTANNLRFAAVADPDNQAVKKKLAWANDETLTIPSTIAEERETNPFLRCAETAIAARYATPGTTEASDVFGTLRGAKDNF